MISALPVSGAAVPNTFGAQFDAAEDLVDQRQLELAEALAAELRAEVRGPQAARLHLLAQRADVHAQVAFERVVRKLRIEQVERCDLLVAELADPLQLCFEFRIGTEIPGHAQPLCCSAAPRSAPDGVTS